MYVSWFDAKEVGKWRKRRRQFPTGTTRLRRSLTLDNAPQAIEWYKKALGAEELSRVAGPDGKIMHAEMRIGDSRIMVNDAMMGSKGPKAIGGSPASLWIYVEDCDALFNRALAAGAQRLRRGHGRHDGSVLGRSQRQP